MDAEGRRDGFTLIELMIVVIIIGMLATIAIPKFAAQTQRARSVEAKSFLKLLAIMEQAFYDDHGRFTTALDSLDVDVADAQYWTFSISQTSATVYTAVATEKQDCNHDLDTSDTWTITNANLIAVWADNS